MPQTYKETLIKEFNMKFGYHQNGDTYLSVECEYDVADWWLQRFDQHLERLAEKVKGMKLEKDNYCTHYQDNCSCRSDKDVKNYNKALSDVLALI